MSAAVRIARRGLLTTVQDLGRPGHQHEGVPPGGAMDAPALAAANLLAGNAPGVAGLELTLLGPTLVFEAPTLVVVAGGDLGATLDGAPMPRLRAVRAVAGSTLAFARPAAGCRGYVAFGGGIDVPPVLGSRSTYLRARMGGLAGRALAHGDVLHLGEPPELAQRIEAGLAPGEAAPRGARPPWLPRPGDAVEIRVMRGSHLDALTAASREALFGRAFRVLPESDRMGYRLRGPTLELSEPLELVSEGVAFGTVQLPPGGAPIVLMADRQTTGGYPRLLEVASADLPLLAQCAPGVEVRFREISLAEAERAYIAAARELSRLALGIALNYR